MWNWKLRDIVFGAIISVACGAIYMGWDVAQAILTATWTPTLTGFTNGVWWIAAGMVAYVVRRPGAALLAGLVSALCEVGFSSPYGWAAVLSGLVQGGGMEIGLAIFAWRRYGVFAMTFAAAIGGIGNTIQWYFQYSGSGFPVSQQIGYLVTTMISGAFFSGLVPMLIGNALKKNGVVRNYEIGRSSALNDAQ